VTGTGTGTGRAEARRYDGRCGRAAVPDHEVHKEVRKALAAVVATDPDEPKPHVVLGRIYERTGLILAIAQRFIKVCGGIVRFDSAPGTGSALAFTLRLERQTRRLFAAAEIMSRG
jgi:hypothetical protein